MSSPSRPFARRPARPGGFTLVEVMIALVIMAVLAGMAWRGVDGLMRLKDSAAATNDRTLRLTTGMSQFEYDLSMLVDTNALASLAFDGNNLRLTRRHPDGVQLVMWTRQAGQWQRWASAPVTHVADLQEAWLRSQQWSAIQPEAVAIVPDVTQFQVYLYRGNGWSNAQSSNDVTTVPAVPVAPPALPSSSSSSPTLAPPAGGGPQPVKSGDAAAAGDPQQQQQQRARQLTVAPTGIRIVLTLPAGDITREQMLPPAGARAAGAQ
jgi:general secretion pathway protein J